MALKALETRKYQPGPEVCMTYIIAMAGVMMAGHALWPCDSSKLLTEEADVPSFLLVVPQLLSCCIVRSFNLSTIQKDS